MPKLDFVKTKEDVFDFLEEYSFDKKNEIDKRQLGKGTGLIKTYMLETETEFTEHTNRLLPVFQDSDLRLSELDSDSIALVKHRSDDFGFLEILSSRHIALHTILKTDVADGIVTKIVRNAPQLDHVWLSGYYLNQVWETVVRSKNNKSVKFRFHQNDYFDEGIWNDVEEDGEIDENEFDDTDADYDEGTGSTIVYTDKIAQIAQKWDRLRELLPAFHSINMLRIPADEQRGGYDFWNVGKVTHRSPSFVDGREQVKWMITDYQLVTEIIEQRAWLRSDEIETPGGDKSTHLSGTPVVYVFPQPLPEHVLSNFIDKVFNRVNKNFRLWGNPIQINPNHYHVYGLDMHLWQRIYLELTVDRFVLILPKGTCGNTVHRLANNIQEFLSPKVQTYIGDQNYEELIMQVITGQYTNE